MNYWNRWLLVSMVSVIVIPSWAATVVERRDTRGEKQKIIMEKQQARIETSDPNYYTLIDLAQGKAYMINTKEKRIVEMAIIGKPPTPPKGLPSPPKMPDIKAELVKKGEGPKIADYPTVNYQVTVNGKVCSENYFSQAAVNIPYVKGFLDAMYQMSNSRKIKGIPAHPCQRAHDELEAKSMKLGVPMKSVMKRNDKGDKVRYEIIKITTDKDVSAGTFVVPPNYQRISEAKMMEEKRKEMMKWMDQAKQSDGRSGPYQPPLRREGEPRSDDRYMPPPPPYREGGRGYDDRYMPPPPPYREGEQGYDNRYMPPPPPYREGERGYDDRYMPPPPPPYRDNDSEYDDRYLPPSTQ